MNSPVDTLKAMRRTYAGEPVERAALDAAIAALTGGEAEPAGYHYVYNYPFPSGGEVIVTDSNGREWNGQKPLRAIPYYYTTPRAAQDGKQPVAWREPTPYGTAYSFASEEVMRDMADWLTPRAAAGMVLAEGWYHFCKGEDGEADDFDLYSVEGNPTAPCPDCVRVNIVAAAALPDAGTLHLGPLDSLSASKLIRPKIDLSALPGDGSAQGGPVVPQLPGNWGEDFSHENGDYECRCVHCGNTFYGHKRRVTCKRCATTRQVPEDIEAILVPLEDDAAGMLADLPGDATALNMQAAAELIRKLAARNATGVQP